MICDELYRQLYGYSKSALWESATEEERIANFEAVKVLYRLLKIFQPVKGDSNVA